MDKHIVIIGGGAAGFFAAINIAEKNPGIEITILEKSSKLLSKVRVSGGGRCNVTHHCFESNGLAENYPRGGKELKLLFREFQAKDTVEWFADRGVALKTEGDGRMFPESNSSQTIIDCFMDEAQKHNIKIITNVQVESIEKEAEVFKLRTNTGIISASKVVVATGGSPSLKGYNGIESLGHMVVAPIPSLFTFNDSSKHFSDLMGLSVPMSEVRIAGSKLSQTGPLLITHWGLSGPAVIKLSAWGAKYLNSVNYNFTVLISWIGPAKEEDIRQKLMAYKLAHPKQVVLKNIVFTTIPSRLWLKLCEMAEIPEGKVYGEISNKQINKLLENLIRCPFEIKGKTTFKEEFVTCGGVDLQEIDLGTMESKKVSGLYFAGEVLNIDGITGGFNFQAAWTTAWIVAKAI